MSLGRPLHLPLHLQLHGRLREGPGWQAAHRARLLRRDQGPSALAGGV